MNELRIAFQPVVELLTGELFGFEALGRCSSGTSPATLLERAHREGSLRELDRAWRTIAIDTAADLFPEEESLRIFLNVDSRILAEPAFEPGFTLRRLRARGLAPSRIVLEISEASPVLEQGMSRLESLAGLYQAQGLGVALDDVGAGWASLRAVVTVRPQLLKLDIGVVRGLANDPMRANLVAAMAEFARRSGMRVIAEGIETAEDLRALLAAGVELGQGWWLSRPMHPETLQLRSLRQVLRSRLRSALAGRADAQASGTWMGRHTPVT